MRKLPLILAGAALFDLGTVMVSHAASTDYFLKIDAMHPASACTAHGGMPEGDQCRLPAPKQGFLKVTFSDLLVSSAKVTTAKTDGTSSKAEMKGSTAIVGVLADKKADAKTSGDR